MKKIFILLLVGLSMVGCGKKKDEQELTDYINKSKSEALVDSINSYIASSMRDVVSGQYAIYDSNDLYLIPAGDNNYSCVTNEMPSYGNWKFLYIGIEYNNYGYNYYAIGEDETGRGIAFTDLETIREKGKDNVYTSSHITKDGYDILYDLYNTKGNNVIYSPTDQTPEYSKLSKVLPITKNNYKEVVIVGSKECKG